MPRNQSLERTLQVLIALRRDRRTLTELAVSLGVCERTIRRDIEALEAVQIPIHHEGDGSWWIDRDFQL